MQAQLDSLLQQTWSNIEIIISDDHSSDGTIEILNSYASDPRFRIFYQDRNLGAVDNFEFATRQATGDYLAFCDQDDIWLPEKLEKLSAAIGDHVLVYCDSILIDENGLSLQRKLSDLRHMYSGKETRGFVFSNTVWGHAVLVKRELLPHALPIPAGIPHDIWVAVKAAALTGIIYLDTPLTLYRQHDKTVTTTLAQKAATRPHEKRYRDFEEKLRWIELLRDNAGDDQPFFNELLRLYAEKSRGSFVWALFFFLLKHQESMFSFTRKSLPSRLIEIRKQSRGEHR
ncbi:MAG: glycosyltransferase [Chitinophagaceae bacterium]|nr:glycosyltransferase [Chitinophagaceae bacterium]